VQETKQEEVVQETKQEEVIAVEETKQEEEVVVQETPKEEPKQEPEVTPSTPLQLSPLPVLFPALLLPVLFPALLPPVSFQFEVCLIFVYPQFLLFFINSNNFTLVCSVGVILHLFVQSE
jgi:hypothetical protein